MDQFINKGPLGALFKLWSDLTPAQRVVVATFAVLAVGLIMLAASNLAKPKMAVLYANLAQEDAGEIVKKISDMKVPFEIQGTTISVPENQVDELKLQLATEGLPAGGTGGYQLFDKTQFGQTEFGEQVTFKRAIEGELTRLISKFTWVSSAVVMVDMPQDSVFASEQEPAKASVWVKPKRAEPVGDEQVSAVVCLVASAVKGLKPQNVTVVDSDGKVLNEGPQMSPSNMSSNQAKQKRQLESELAQNIQSMLAKTLGPDKSVVRVSAELNFDQIQQSQTSYQPATPATGQTPAKGVPINEVTTSEDYKGNVMPTGGNVPAPATRGGGPNDSYTRSDSKVEWGVDKTVKETVSAPGAVKRLSVAVLVDEKVPLTQLGSIRQTVMAAAGIDQKNRQDVVSVERIKFSTEQQQKIAEQAKTDSRNELIMSIAKNASAVMILVAFLFFLKKTIRQIKVPLTRTDIIAQTKAREYAPSSNVDTSDLLSAIGSAAPPAQPQAPAPVEAVPVQKYPEPPPIPEEVASAKPEDLARLVRTWMSEQ